MKKLFLIDASGYIHRAYHALPPLTNSRGQMVNAVFGFSRMVQKVLKLEKPDYLGVCFDTPGPTFRDVEFMEYKANREAPEETLVTQFPFVTELAEAWGLPCIKKEGFEADDLIATLAKKGLETGCTVVIMSGDKDVLQVVRDGVLVRDEIRRVEFDKEAVQKRFGIKPDQLVDFQALMGDKIDNIPGIPGVGEKTAQKLISEFGTLENLYDHLQNAPEKLQAKLEEYKNAVFRNRRLVKLREDVPLDLTIADLILKPIDQPRWDRIINELEFKDNISGSNSRSEDADLKSNESRNIKIVFNNQDLDELRDDFNHSEVFAYDVETDGLNQNACQLIGLSISTSSDKAFYIPLKHNYLGAPEQIPWETVKNCCFPFFKSNKKIKVGHNLKFDNSVLARYGIEINGPQFDTMVAAYCLDPARPSFGLKNLVGVILEEKMTAYEKLLSETGTETFRQVPIEKAAKYSGADAECAFRLKDVFEKQLGEKNLQRLFYDLEMPLVEVLAAMEKAGIKIDFKHLHEVKKRFENDKSNIRKEIFSSAGEEFVLDSPKQLSRILFEKLKLPALKKTKTGFSTNEEVLSKLSKNHPICAKIIFYRELAKLTSTYVDSLLELADPQTHRIHTNFNQTGTITGRFSSSDPNLQNIPVRSQHGKEIKKAFVPSPGNVFISADYSQIDLRALAHISGDPVLVKTFRENGDVHTQTAGQIFHVDESQVTPEMRQRAKAINFGIVYGQQAFGLSQTLGIGVGDAQDFINKYFERYAGVKSWIDKTLAETRKTGEVSTLSGRKRPVSGISSPNGAVRGFAERISINTPIQGSSADIIKSAMIKIYQELNHRNLKTQLLVQVHDELLFDVPESEVSEVIPVIKNGMEKAYDLQVPLVADMKCGLNWNDMEKIGGN